MPKLPSLSELVDAIKNDEKFQEFHEFNDEMLIDEEYKKYFVYSFGITNIHPLF
ncbi:1817_t:CDS:1, partial [Funneliformis caledonium]